MSRRQRSLISMMKQPTKDSVLLRDYIGCFTEKNTTTNTDLLNELSYVQAGILSAQVSWWQCSGFCLAYKYFGVINGNTCLCGNTLNWLAPQVTDVTTECNTACSGTGFSNYACGGVNRIHLFVTIGQGPTPSLSITSSSVSSSSSSITASPSSTAVCPAGQSISTFLGTFIVECSLQRTGTNLGTAPATDYNTCVLICGFSTVCLAVTWNPTTQVCILLGTPIGDPPTVNTDIWGAVSSTVSSPSAVCPSGTTITTAGGVFAVECLLKRSGSDLGLAIVPDYNGCVQACGLNIFCKAVVWDLTYRTCNLLGGLIGPAVSNNNIWGALMTTVTSTVSSTVSSTTSTSPSASATCPNGQTINTLFGTFTVECGLQRTGTNLGSPSAQDYNSCVGICGSIALCFAVTWNPTTRVCILLGTPIGDPPTGNINIWGAVSSTTSTVSTTSSTATSPSTGGGCPAGQTITASSRTFIVECSQQRPGTTLTFPSTPPATYVDCVQACGANPSCQAVVWNPLLNTCVLLGSVGDPFTNILVWGAVSSTVSTTSSSTVSSSPSATILIPTHHIHVINTHVTHTSAMHTHATHTPAMDTDAPPFWPPWWLASPPGGDGEFDFRDYDEWHRWWLRFNALKHPNRPLSNAMAVSPEEDSLPVDDDPNSNGVDEDELDPIPDIWEHWLSCFSEWLDNKDDEDDTLDGITLSEDGEDIDEGDDEYLRNMWKGFWDFYLDQQQNKDDTEKHESFGKHPPSVESADDDDGSNTEDSSPQEDSFPVGRPEWDDFWDWFNRQSVVEESSLVESDGQFTHPPSSTSANTRGIGGNGIQKDVNPVTDGNLFEKDTTCIKSTTTYTIYPDWFRE